MSSQERVLTPESGMSSGDSLRTHGSSSPEAIPRDGNHFLRPIARHNGDECELCERLDARHGHLNKVACRTAKFAEAMVAAGSIEAKAAHQWGYLAGLWDDLGKFAPQRTP